MSEHIHVVNALKIRNQLGEVLDLLEAGGRPIMVSKGRKIRAVLITPEDFEARFVDYLAEDRRQRFLDALDGARAPRTRDEESLDALRRLRGELA